MSQRPLTSVLVLSETRALLLDRRGESLCSFTGEGAEQEARDMAEEIEAQLRGRLEP